MAITIPVNVITEGVKKRLTGVWRICAMGVLGTSVTNTSVMETLSLNASLVKATSAVRNVLKRYLSEANDSPKKGKPMNTKWEEDYCNKFGLCKQQSKYAKCQCGKEIAFIKDQITEAEKRGYERGQIDQTNLIVNTLMDIDKGNHSKASPTPEQMDKMFMNTWEGKPLESDMPESYPVYSVYDLKGIAISEQSESLVKRAQQEIAEQIIEDIPEWMDVEPHNLKDQLRKKYIKKETD